jgi:hypothetical protein
MYVIIIALKREFKHMSNSECLGKKGERDFASWCSSVGIVCNGSESEDKYGWDFIIEYKRPYKIEIPIDKQSVKIECKIQVKATISKKNKSFSISVNNLLNLIDYHYPVFFLLIYYKNENSILKPYKSVMVHLGENLIFRTLKRVRELEKDKKNNDLHKVKINFSYNQSDFLIDLDGNEIKNKIDSIIKGNIDEYIIWKQNIKKKVGHPFQKMILNIKSEDNIFPTLQDHLLGYKNKLDVTDIKVFDSRFNIDLLTFKEDYGYITINIPPKEVKVTIKKKEYESGYDTIWKYKNTNYFSDILPSEYHKFELLLCFIKIFNHENKIKFSANLNFDIKYNFNDLINSIRIIKDFYESENRKEKMIIIINVIDKDPLVIRTNFSNFISQNITLEKLDEYFKLLNIILKIKNIFNFDDINISLNDVIENSQKLFQIDVFFENKNILKFDTDQNINKDSYFCIPFIFDIILDENIFIFNFLIHGVPSYKKHLKNGFNEFIFQNINYTIINKYHFLKQCPLTIKDLLKESWKESNNINPQSIIFSINEEYYQIIRELIPE